jgi:hypothetical protein
MGQGVLDGYEGHESRYDRMDGELEGVREKPL